MSSASGVCQNGGYCFGSQSQWIKPCSEVLAASGWRWGVASGYGPLSIPLFYLPHAAPLQGAVRWDCWVNQAMAIALCINAFTVCRFAMGLDRFE